jgi:aspartyl aminopeptidase
MTHTSGWKSKSKADIKEIFRFCEAYKVFLDEAKTEREAVRCIGNLLSGAGFEESPGRGDRMFRIHKGKEAIAFVRGEEPMTNGLRIIAAHVDAPRLDLKQNPLYEDLDIALLRTHYYGGIKKYHWVSIPLAIHGTVVKADGRAVDIILGEDKDDPVFTIDDLLPHLSRKTQADKQISEAIEGEKLRLLFGSLPLAGEERESVKKGVLKIMEETYGLVEEDFVSAELEVVPAFPARDVGIDRTLVGAYGQDDRICAYTLLKAITDCPTPRHSCLAIFTDKEEIGSEGDTGMQSHFLQIFLYDVLESLGMTADEVTVKRTLFASRALSADVNGAMNPTYQDVHEKQNASYLGRGVCVTKFTGHGGKVGASDAHAEYVGHIRKLFNDGGIVWHTGELGKVDEGGGGTVAKHLAVYGMDIVDCGPPLLAMHSPFEISSKLDVYETYKAFRLFFQST